MKNSAVFDRKAILKLLLGAALGAVTIYLAFRGVSIPDLLGALRQADPWLVAAGVLIILLNVAVVSFRWWVTLIRSWQTAEYTALLEGVYLGQTFNILLPARLGELARILFVSDKTDLTKSRLLGSLVLEKALDLFTFGGALFLLLISLSLPGWVAEPAWTLIWLGLIAVLAAVVLSLWGRQLLRWGSHRS